MSENKIQKLSQPNSETTSTTGESPVIPKSLLIFDFDDTLFCTKYFDSFSLPYQDIFTFKISLEEVNPCLFKEIKELEKTIIELFVKLQNNNNDVVIVSNADMRWINNCLTHFLEELKEYINENNIKVYSAKNMYSKMEKEEIARGDSTRISTSWKIKCFEKVIKDIYGEENENESENENNTCETSIDLNVLSIGDGEDEKKAVFKLNKNKFNFCQNLQTKFIRMIDYPSASSIIIQLEYLQNNIKEILSSNKTIYKMIIEIINGTAQIKCVPKKKKNKKDKLNIIYSTFDAQKKINLTENSLKEKDEDILLFKNLNDFEQYESYNNSLFEYIDSDEDLLRKNLFLGKKKYY